MRSSETISGNLVRHSATWRGKRTVLDVSIFFNSKAVCSGGVGINQYSVHNISYSGSRARAIPHNSLKYQGDESKREKD